jgi:uncharacterized membrane protein YgaE (UPF0421/DUF939 family)
MSVKEAGESGLRSDAAAIGVDWTAMAVLVHSARTAVAAVSSLLVAQLFGLPEAFWAPITTLVIEQSSLGAALAVSWHRLVGTFLGAVVGAIVASQPGPHVLAFGASVFILGPLRVMTRSDLNGYRFGAITLVIVLLVPRSAPAWQIALHRFIEVSIGIGVALILATLWPERGKPEFLTRLHHNVTSTEHTESV